ncbi:MAG: 3'-5' exonuclease [Halobacteriovoraceae bacterium]|nr:3'-5' exonuclease [Halobacteriovoraceae bacterium]
MDKQLNKSEFLQSQINRLKQEKLLSIFPNGVLALDLETTGLSPVVDKIVEVSAIKVTPIGVSIFDEICDPEVTIDQSIIDIHGIDNQMVKGKRKIGAVLEDLIHFIEDLPIIAHNAKFDIGFLVFLMHQNKIFFPHSDIYCSCDFSRKVNKDVKNHKLGNLAKHFKIHLSNHHRALDDAYVSLELIIQGALNGQNDFIQKAKQFNFSDFKELDLMQIPKHLKSLVEFAFKQEPIQIKYAGGSKKNQFRPVKPVSILPTPSGTILYALCIETDTYKQYSLKKILEIKN